ncbi:MAG: hypothetical protein KGY68_02935 [Candidatus Thermoplasmatota archaeon]|nr:hypothetical protein [Candidatus Thermoplasmatota archaeon]
MKVQSKTILKDNLGLTFAILAVTILLIGSLTPLSMTATAAEDDGEEEVGVPEWNEGDKWRYSDKVPMPNEASPDPGDDKVIETIMEKEVTDENFRVNAYGPGGEKKTYETYQVREIHNPDNPENRWEGDFYYWKDNLAQVYNNPEGNVPSAYHPPIVDLDFPLYVGKKWSTDKEYDLARYFEGPPDPDDVDEGEYPEPDREYAFLGRVENRTTKEIELEKGVKEFETYMVNLTLVGYDREGGKTEITRYEMYYSPEVKNIVHTDIFGVRRMPEDYSVGDDVMENFIGNETLLGFEADPYNPDDEGEPSLLGVGIVLLILGVGTASFYVYKKVRSSF